MATAYEILNASVERMLADLNFLREQNAQLEADLVTQRLQNAHTLAEAERMAARIDSLLTRLGVATSASPLAVALRAKQQSEENTAQAELPLPVQSTMVIRNVSFKAEPNGAAP